MYLELGLQNYLKTSDYIFFSLFCFGLPRIILPMVPRFVNATIKAKEEV